VRVITPQDLWKLPRVGAPAPAGNGRVVVPVITYDIDANKGNGRLWLIPPHAEPRPLTVDEFNAAKPAVSPQRDQVAFVASIGEGQKQVYVGSLDAESGPDSLKPLTDLPLGALGAKWLPDASSLVVVAYVLKGHLDVEATAVEVAKRKDEKYTVHVTEDATYRYWDTWLTTGEVPHLFLLDLASGDFRDLTPTSTRWWNWPNTDDPWDSYDISPSGGHLAYSADKSDPPHRHLHRGIFEIDLSTGNETDITPDGVAHAKRPRYSRDGRLIAYGFQVVPDFYGDRVRLGIYERSSGRHRVLTEEWDRSAEDWEFDGRDDLVLTSEDVGTGKLFRLALGSIVPEVIGQGGTLSVPAVDDEGVVFLLHHSLNDPPEVMRLGAGGSLESVTAFARTLLARTDWGPIEEITVPGADMEPVQFFLIHPPGTTDQSSATHRRRPLLHLIHGGPHGMFSDGWMWRWHAQTFAAQGYLVAMVNFHGSTSFGQDFTTSIHGAWGDKPYRDIEAVTDFLIGEGLVDEDRMAVAGGSYGGYLVAFITAQTNRYACAVAHAAVTNLGGMYASDLTAGRVLAYGAEVFEDRAKVDRYSPSSHAAGYATPTLVIAGERDYRVPSTQGLELYGVLKAKGVPARLLYYQGENHWILNPQASLHWYGEVLRWLDLYLR
jgi:dipeptidyl aminopeptidase/acylaminoacyl peptidase